MATGVEVGREPTAWRPTQLQLVLFTTSPPGIMQNDWWRAVMGSDPDETTSKRHEFTQTGSMGDASISLAADLIKITWTMSPKINPEEPPDGIPTLGTFLQVKERFKDLFRDWITEGSPPIKRLDFGCNLAQPVADHVEAYRVLGEWLRPVVVVDPTSTDFLYRINRRRTSTSGIPNLKINRISTWHAVKFSISAQTLTLSTNEISQPVQVLPAQYAGMLGIDINSDAEHENELSRDSLRQLLDELVSLAVEIATDGDKP